MSDSKIKQLGITEFYESESKKNTTNKTTKEKSMRKSKSKKKDLVSSTSKMNKEENENAVIKKSTSRKSKGMVIENSKKKSSSKKNTMAIEELKEERLSEGMMKVEEQNPLLNIADENSIQKYFNIYIKDNNGKDKESYFDSESQHMLIARLKKREGSLRKSSLKKTDKDTTVFDYFERHKKSAKGKMSSKRKPKRSLSGSKRKSKMMKTPSMKKQTNRGTNMKNASMRVRRGSESPNNNDSAYVFKYEFRRATPAEIKETGKKTILTSVKKSKRLNSMDKANEVTESLLNKVDCHYIPTEHEQLSPADKETKRIQSKLKRKGTPYKKSRESLGEMVIDKKEIEPLPLEDKIVKSIIDPDFDNKGFFAVCKLNQAGERKLGVKYAIVPLKIFDPITESHKAQLVHSDAKKMYEDHCYLNYNKDVLDLIAERRK